MSRASVQRVIHFRSFSKADRDFCLELFDANCPEFFAPGERADYEAFLRASPDFYRVGIVQGKIVAAFGLRILPGNHRGRINWIMLHPTMQGQGIGDVVMKGVLETAYENAVQTLDISASQKSASFFQRYGAVTTSLQPEGWGPNLDRVEMVLFL